MYSKYKTIWWDCIYLCYFALLALVHHLHYYNLTAVLKISENGKFYSFKQTN